MRSYYPHVVMLVLMAVWGGSYAVVKVTLESLSPVLVVALRFWIGALCLALCLGRNAISDLRRARRPGLITGVALGVGYMMQTYGLQETSASMGGFLAGLIVMLVAVGGYFFLDARFGKQSVAGILLGLVGLVLLCWPQAQVGGQEDTARGILLQIGSSTCFAAHILMLSHYGRSVPVIAYCVWQLVFVGILGTIAAFLTPTGLAAGGAPFAGIDWTPQLIACVAYLGLPATGIGIAIQSKIQHRVPSTHLALLFATQPLIAALVAWILLSDSMSALQLVGGATIAAGILVTSLADS